MSSSPFYRLQKEDSIPSRELEPSELPKPLDSADCFARFLYFGVTVSESLPQRATPRTGPQSQRFDFVRPCCPIWQTLALLIGSLPGLETTAMLPLSETEQELSLALLHEKSQGMLPAMSLYAPGKATSKGVEKG